MSDTTLLVAGPELAAYGFPDGHPFGPDRHDAFMAALERSPVFAALDVVAAEPADREALESFHTGAYVDFVRERSARGDGWLDQGDTPAFPGPRGAREATIPPSTKLRGASEDDE